MLEAPVQKEVERVVSDQIEDFQQRSKVKFGFLGGLNTERVSGRVAQ